jgi:predicted deacetylase
MNSKRERPVSATDQPVLCVSIHDVAPATWAECQRLHDAVRAVADIPLTWLVVPCYRGQGHVPRHYAHGLGALLARGHELALHGYTHVDEAAAPATPGARFLRRVLTQGEGEFAAINTAEARRRLDLGVAWFARHGWPLSGFVAPAWMLGREAWTALLAYPFLYTSSFRKLFWLASGSNMFAPTLVYTARNAGGRLVSPLACQALARLHGAQPVLRFALHPRDARHPTLLRHAQGLLDHLLETRVALTKAELAHYYQYGPQRPPAPQ